MCVYGEDGHSSSLWPESENRCLASCPGVPLWATVSAYGGLVCGRQLATFSQYKRVSMFRFMAFMFLQSP